MGFSSARPGSPSVGSCGPGREKTHFSHALLTPSIMPVGRNCLSSRLSLAANARSQGMSPESGPVLGPRASSRGPACWQEITALSSDESPLSTTPLRQFGQGPRDTTPLGQESPGATPRVQTSCLWWKTTMVRNWFPPKCPHSGPSGCCILRICCGHWSSRGGCIQEKRKKRSLKPVGCGHFGETEVDAPAD